MATGTDEPMDDEHRKILRRCKGTLVKDMEPRQVLLQMEDPLLFTTDEENQIMSRVTRQLQCDALLDMLPRKGAKAYDIFKKTIAIVQPHLTRTIIEAENTILRSELRIERAKSADLRRRLIHRTVKDGNPKDDELEKLGSDIGEIWVKLGRRLDVSDAKLKEIDKAHSLLSEKGYHALREWEHKKGTDGATYQALCDALQHDLIQRQDLADKFCYIKVMDTGTRPLAMGRPEPSRPVQAEQGSFTEVNTGIRPLAVERVEPSGPIPAENLETSDSQIMDSVERNQVCLQCTKLAEELNDLKTQIGRLHQQQLTHEEVNKYKNAVSRAFLPSEKDFPSPTGVLSSLIRDSSVKPVATRSSEGPGEASDIFDHSEAKESGTDEKMNSWWCVDLSENYRLVITHYALRHGKKDGKAILQRWQLQGSNDKDKWTNIYYTPDLSQFRAPRPFVTGRWTVSGEVGAFRYFRIFQTGLNSSKKYGIYLSGIELYGTLAKM